MMEHIVPITEAKGRLNELVREAESHNVILARHGRPAAVLVSPARLEELLEQIETSTIASRSTSLARVIPPAH